MILRKLQISDDIVWILLFHSFSPTDEASERCWFNFTGLTLITSWNHLWNRVPDGKFSHDSCWKKENLGPKTWGESKQSKYFWGLKGTACTANLHNGLVWTYTNNWEGIVWERCVCLSSPQGVKSLGVPKVAGTNNTLSFNFTAISTTNPFPTVPRSCQNQKEARWEGVSLEGAQLWEVSPLHPPALSSKTFLKTFLLG